MERIDSHIDGADDEKGVLHKGSIRDCQNAQNRLQFFAMETLRNASLHEENPTPTDQEDDADDIDALLVTRWCRLGMIQKTP